MTVRLHDRDDGVTRGHDDVLEAGVAVGGRAPARGAPERLGGVR